MNDKNSSKLEANTHFNHEVVTIQLTYGQLKSLSLLTSLQAAKLKDAALTQYEPRVDWYRRLTRDLAHQLAGFTDYFNGRE